MLNSQPDVTNTRSDLFNHYAQPTIWWLAIKKRKYGNVFTEGRGDNDFARSIFARQYERRRILAYNLETTLSR